MKEAFDQESEHFNELIDAFVAFKSTKDCKKFLEDLCTPTELKAFVDRLQVAKQIRDGVSYRTIAEEVGASTATITRVGRSLKYGPGGYETALKLLGAKKRSKG